jgi:hypothetical protein
MMMSPIINVDKVCRLCMEESTLLLPIFSQDNSEHENVLLPHMIMTLASIQVNVILRERRINEFCSSDFLFIMYHVGIK